MMKQAFSQILCVSVCALMAMSVSSMAIGPGGGQGPAALKQIKDLAKNFDISPDKIRALLDGGLDLSQAKGALSMAKQAVGKGDLSMDAAVDKITAMVKDGAGLEDIAKKLDVDLPDVDATAGDAKSAVKKAGKNLGAGPSK